MEQGKQGAPVAQIRRAQTADAAEVARLSGELGYPVEAARMADRLALLLADPRQFVAVADAGAAGLLGWISAEDRRLLVAGRKLEIMGLVVDARARRGGLGAALVAAAGAWGRERGFDHLVVRSNVNRPESHRFYQGLQFEASKTQHVYTLPLRP